SPTSDTPAYVPPEPPPAPGLASIVPNAGSTNEGAQLTMTAAGSDFVDGDTIAFDAAPQATTFVDSATLTCIIPASAVEIVAQVTVMGVNGTSNAVPFTYTDPVIPEVR